MIGILTERSRPGQYTFAAFFTIKPAIRNSNSRKSKNFGVSELSESGQDHVRDGYSGKELAHSGIGGLRENLPIGQPGDRVGRSWSRAGKNRRADLHEKSRR